MKKAILFYISAIVSLSSFSQTKNDFKSIEQKIQKEIEKETLPSISIAVAKDGKIIYENAFGWSDVKTKTKATINTAYQIASVSKPMTATGLMVLNHKKALYIDSSASIYMKPLKFNAYEGELMDVKLKNLLNHTSGLGTYFDISYADETRKQDNFENAFKKYGNLYHPPGLISEYSNLGYGLIDYIITKQSGKSYAQFMEQEVFKPLGMTNSFVQSTNRKSIQIAEKYDTNLKELPHILNNTYGAGNIYSSIHDLILFGIFNLKNDLPNQKKILTNDEIDLMHYYKNNNTFYHYYDSTYYSLGWYSKLNDNGYKIIWHEGGMMGASSIIKLIPDKNIAIAVIINTSNRQFCNDIVNELSKIVLPEYQPTPLNETTEIANYKTYTSDSTYLGDWNGTIKVEDLDIPCSMKFQPDGTIIITYIDFTYKSYFTQNNPIPHKTILLAGIVHKASFIGMFPGTLPSKDIQQKFSQIMSLKLYKKENTLSGTIVALAASDREYYAYPYYIVLNKK